MSRQRDRSGGIREMGEDGVSFQPGVIHIREPEAYTTINSQPRNKSDGREEST